MTASTATKKRCWSFHVTGVNRKKGSKIKEATVLSSFRERYTAVRRLALSSITSVNDAKSSGGGAGSSKTVCIEVQFIGPQPSQGPGALLCNLLSGTSVEARPIELRRGRENKRKRRHGGSDEGSDPEDRREGKFARPDILRRQKELNEKRASLLLTPDLSSHRSDPLPTRTQGLSSHRVSDDTTTTYIKVSDELEQVPAPLTRPVYLTPLSLKGLAAFPSPPSTPPNEIPPSTPPSKVLPSTPPCEELQLPLLTTPRTDIVLPLLRPQKKIVLQPTSNTQSDGVPPPTTSNAAATLALRNGALPPSALRKDPRNVALPPSTPRDDLRNGALPPSCTRDDPRNDVDVPRPSTPSSNDTAVAVAPPDTRMHWEDVICRINAPPPSRGLVGRQHSLDIGDIIASCCSGGDEEEDGDEDGTDGEVFSSTGSGKESDDEEDAVAAAARGARDPHIDVDGCAASLYDPSLMYDIADELLDPPCSVHQQQQQQCLTTITRPFLSCARGILRGTSFQYADYIGLDSSHSAFAGVVEADAQKDSFAQHSRDRSGLESVGFPDSGVVASAEDVCRVPSSTPALVSSGTTATGQPNVVVGLVPEFQECDFEGHHQPSSPTDSTFSSRHHYQLVIAGLESVEHEAHNLVATAHFSVDASHKVGRRASPIRVGANGQSHAALFYPSMQAIWPEVYITNNVRTVEVDVTVDIRSRDGAFHHTTPNLKVMYRRTPFCCTED